jgi:BirA family biotin operon repressor/biotin-[acetyl-CoA-carboxylase] ligase
MPYNGPFDLAWVDERLPSRRIEWFPSIDSTMTVAARLAREGCPSGTIVGADEQTVGIGRHGHFWHSEPEAGLYVSFVLRLPVSPERLPLVTLAVGLATKQTIEEMSALSADLRWPNDVLIEEKKCAGILAQMEGDAIVAGIGINVGHTGFPEEIRDMATSLALAGARVTREDLLVALARAIDEHCGILAWEGPSAILNMFTRASSFAVGRRVRVDQSGTVIEGITCGLDPTGFLLVRQDNGVETAILAGGVRPA